MITATQSRLLGEVLKDMGYINEGQLPSGPQNQGTVPAEDDRSDSRGLRLCHGTAGVPSHRGPVAGLDERQLLIKSDY